MCIYIIIGIVNNSIYAGDTHHYAIVNGTIIPVTQDTILQGTLIINGDRIDDLGVDIPIPADAEIVDADGLFIYAPWVGDIFYTFVFCI